MKKPISIALAGLTTLLSTVCLWAGLDYTVEHPGDYRRWTHVMSYLIGPQSPAHEKNGGLHYFYANEKALEGYRTGKFPDGSVLIDERNKAEEKEGKTTAGSRLGFGVMVKDSRRYGATGGWGFEIFAGDKTNGMLNAEVRQRCFDCHSKPEARDFVFGHWRR